MSEYDGYFEQLKLDRELRFSARVARAILRALGRSRREIADLENEADGASAVEGLSPTWLTGRLNLPVGLAAVEDRAAAEALADWLSESGQVKSRERVLARLDDVKELHPGLPYCAMFVKSARDYAWFGYAAVLHDAMPVLAAHAKARPALHFVLRSRHVVVQAASDFLDAAVSVGVLPRRSGD